MEETVFGQSIFGQYVCFSGFTICAAQKGGDRRVGSRRVEGPKFCAFSVPLPPPGLLFLSLIVCLFVCLFVEFWWCFEAPKPLGFHTTTREPTQVGRTHETQHATRNTHKRIGPNRTGQTSSCPSPLDVLTRSRDPTLVPQCGVRRFLFCQVFMFGCLACPAP